MIIWQDESLILSSQDFSDTSIILKVFSKNHGVRKGLVRGAKKKNKAYIFESGNLVLASFKARTDDMLGIFNIDLIKPCPAIYLKERLKFSAIISILNLIEFCLLENDVESDLYHYTKLLINKVFTTDNDWLIDYVRWEVFLLKQVGFGLELSKCILTNKTENLKYLSPKSGCAVEKNAGEKWKAKLLLLPDFLINYADNQIVKKKDLLDGLKITSNFLYKFSLSINKILPFTRRDFIDIILNYENIN